MSAAERLTRAGGLGRAVLWSYGPMWRRRSMRAFYARFLRPGDLAFDVGAHAGNRVPAFRALGARVVAVEPQPDLVRVLRALHGWRWAEPHLAIEACAVGAAPGRAVLHISSRSPTVSSLAESWRADVQRDHRFAGIRWDRTVDVPVHTLDELIERYGEPQFCKLDVEGFELDALAGLSRPLAALSFEYIPVVRDRAVACVRRLTELGEYRYTYSPGETWRLATRGWLSAEQIIAALNSLPPTARSGDVYARRADIIG